MNAKELACAHAILRKALREVDDDERPPGPWHAGGPLLSCPSVEQIAISLWCAELLDGRATAAERKTIAKIAERVREFIAAPAVTWERSPEYAELSALGEAGKSDSAPLLCARRAASGAATYARGKPDLVFSSASAAVMRTVAELREDPEPMTVRDFLAALDERLMRAELAGALKERLKREPPTVERVLFRGGSVAPPSLFIARLADGRYGFLGKLGTGRASRWTWLEGDRADVVANVPDSLFDAVAARVP